MKVFFFAPVFNQARELPRVLAEFREAAPPGVELLLVNNGSSDGWVEFDWHAPWLHTYGFEYYLYAKVLLDRTIAWTEVPITMRYPEAGRYSKIRPGRDWYAMLKPWLRARLDGRGFQNS